MNIKEFSKKRVQDSMFAFSANGHRCELNLKKDKAQFVVDNTPLTETTLADAVGEFLAHIGAVEKLSTQTLAKVEIDEVSRKDFSKKLKEAIDLAYSNGLEKITFSGKEIAIPHSMKDSYICENKICSLEDLEELFYPRIEDELQDRVINGQTVKVKELQNSEEAKKFLEENPGYSAVDEDNGKIYVTI